jgi:uncharacterized membrane protein
VAAAAVGAVPQAIATSVIAPVVLPVATETVDLPYLAEVTASTSA